MADLVETVDEVIDNIVTLNKFASGTNAEQKFHNKRVKNGKLFVVLQTGSGALFAPSKYVGYRGNDLSHESDLDNRDGRITNQRITDLVGPPIDKGDHLYERIDRQFLDYCAKYLIVPSTHHKARRYWLVDNFVSADEVKSDDFYEGASQNIRVNKYERNAAARRVCLAHYGYDCSVCGMNFAERYGDLGEDFIHVHHLVPLSEIGRAYIVDPIDDLRPVCPNCHSMIHRGGELISIEELRAKMRAAKG